MGVFLQICCIFSEHLFLRATLEGCFCSNNWINNTRAKTKFLRRMQTWVWSNLFITLLLKDTLNVFDDFKNKQSILWSNMFWYVKVCIFWKCIQYTMHWSKTQMLKKFPSEKINGTKNAILFSLASSKSSQFYFNLRFLHELSHKARFVSFLLNFIFLFNKVHGLFGFKML